MKKLFLSVVAVLSLSTVVAQETRFGVKAGVDLATTKYRFQGYDGYYFAEDRTVTGTETGFYGGGFVNIGIADKFAIQPEVLFIAVNDFNMLSLPVLFDYEFIEKFHAVAGPSLTYLLDADEDEFKFNFDFGASFDITDDFEANAKYSVGFGDVSVGGLFLGVGYKF